MRRAVLAALALLLAGCTTLTRRTNVVREPSYVVSPQATPLGRSVLAEEKSHPGQSGFGLLSYGQEALVARTAIIDAATQSIDAQYYIYAADDAGSFLLLHLIDAARRGVRVRLLLDDYNTRDDRELATLSTLPNFQIRVFNPVAFRARWARLPEYILTFGKADRRMHNKLLIGDNAWAILGGRNIGDDYFSLQTKVAFRDFDLIAAGPAVRVASSAFDEYWNSPWAVPATALVGERPKPKDFERLMRRVQQRAANTSAFSREYQGIRSMYLNGLLHDSAGLVWAPGEIISDSPSLAGGDNPEQEVARRLDEEWDRTEREALVEAAYFVPGERGVEKFAEMIRRGVSVKLLTCALATTDVPIVYSAYERYRRKLLECGVDLYEYRITTPRQGPQRRPPWYRSGRSYAVLHSKAIVFDRSRIWVGSLNLDPRSTRLNTEIAAIVDSPVLARRLALDMQADMAPDRSWHVTLEKGRVVWRAENDGKPVQRAHEPASWLRRLDALLVRIFPAIENQL